MFLTCRIEEYRAVFRDCQVEETDMRKLLHAAQFFPSDQDQFSTGFQEPSQRLHSAS